MAYAQKVDGHRALLFTSASPGGTVWVQTRRGALVQDRWPDLVAAAEAQLRHGLVLDGELVVWDAEAGRLSFEALQRRAAARVGPGPGRAVAGQPREPEGPGQDADGLGCLPAWPGLLGLSPPATLSPSRAAWPGPGSGRC
ncbi:ATP-dependent DNA ligase [Streptomyces sp. NPDC054849]